MRFEGLRLEDAVIRFVQLDLNRAPENRAA
jgi:hypothetical protein